MRAGMVWGEFLERPSRFSVWVKLNGRRELVHLPNPGRLLSILVPGRPLLLRPAAGGPRKTRYTAVGAELEGMLVSLDSTLPNRFFPQALALGLIPPLAGWTLAGKEPRMGAGRADFLLRQGDEKMLVEVKSVTWVEGGVALFPDAPTARGRRHLKELAQAVREGKRASLAFVVQRPDAVAFGPSPIDPGFAKALREALATGVEAFALVCSFDGTQLELVRFLGRTALRL
ncbi:TPA: DNA/RNA nuclease SfsA [Candidatus Acetothermia bacterium]|nr:DNA/RNA nuclease SfsA [Candidatus Acetothermia bacterium]